MLQNIFRLGLWLTGRDVFFHQQIRTEHGVLQTVFQHDRMLRYKTHRGCNWKSTFWKKRRRYLREKNLETLSTSLTLDIVSSKLFLVLARKPDNLIKVTQDNRISFFMLEKISVDIQSYRIQINKIPSYQLVLGFLGFDQRRETCLRNKNLQAAQTQFWRQFS